MWFEVNEGTGVDPLGIWDLERYRWISSKLVITRLHAKWKLLIQLHIFNKLVLPKGKVKLNYLVSWGTERGD